jgi:hypothetical protein
MIDFVVISMSILIPLLLIGVWLLAELRWQRLTRVLIGFTCILYFALQLWVSATVARQHLTLHAISLNVIERLLESGQEQQVRRAIDAYKDEDGKTGNAGEAAARMMSILQE